MSGPALAGAPGAAPRARHLRRTWNQNSKDTQGVLAYEDFKFVVQFAEPSLPSPMVRARVLSPPAGTPAPAPGTLAARKRSVCCACVCDSLRSVAFGCVWACV